MSVNADASDMDRCDPAEVTYLEPDFADDVKAALADPDRRGEMLELLEQCAGLVVSRDGSADGQWLFAFEPSVLPLDSPIRWTLHPDYWPTT